MIAGKNADRIVSEIGVEHLKADLSQGDASVTAKASVLKAALEAAYEAGRAKRDLEEIDASLLFWQLMESLPDHVYFKDLRSRFICLNHSLAQFFKLDSPEQAVGRSDFDFFQERFAQVKFEAEQEVIRTGEGFAFREERDRRADGVEKWALTTKLPLRDAEGKVCGTFGLSRDITEAKQVEIELARQRRLLETIIDILPCRVFVRNANGQFLLVNEEYRKGIGIPTRDAIVGKRLTEIRQDKLALQNAEEDRIVIERDHSIRNRIEYDRSIMGNNRWVLSSKVPLHSPEGEVEGVVGVALDITEQKEAENEARVAQREIRKKNEQFEAELLVARQLQEHLMAMGFDSDRLYRKTGAAWSLEASYLYRPSHHLAGDFFYLVPVAEGKLGILVCDVMGHGVKAALVTTLLRGLILEDPTLLGNPGAVLAHLNANLVKLAEDKEFPRFVTAVYAVVDLDHGSVSLSNAGHPTPIWRIEDNAGARYEKCPSDRIGPALGLIEGERFENDEFQFSQRTELLFFTDGIIEQKTADGSEFGVANFQKALLGNERESLPEQLKGVSAVLSRATKTKVMDDDICVVAVRIEPAG